MNTVFSNATEADLNAGDNICIICREEMVAVASNSRDQTGNVPKCLPCTHIFHCACLKTWFQRQQTCPTCRMDILRNAQQQRTAAPNNDRRPNQNATPNVANNAPSVTPNVSTQQFSATATSPPPSSPMNAPPFSPAVFPWLLPPPGSDQATAGPNFSTMPTPFAPPFMFPGMSMFSRPMPELSSEDMAKMSDEDLMRLEKQGREGIEFRIQTIQRIQTLLDAAVLQMNAYMISVRNMTNGQNISVNVPHTAKAEDDRGDVVTAQSSSDISNNDDQVKPSEHIVVEDKPEENKDESPSEELVKIRDRRLRKFDSQPNEGAEVNES